MGLVNEKTSEDIMMQLVAWELLGVDDIDPKPLLRRLPDQDLFSILENIMAKPDVREFVSVQMVELEVMHRRGVLLEDWNYERDGQCVSLTFVVVPNVVWMPRRAVA